MFRPAPGRQLLPPAIAAVLALLCVGAAAAPSDASVGVVHRVATRERVVALSFDDGPRPPYTNAILDALRDQGVVATFFLVGENVQRYPTLARRIVREGHAIGNHGWQHLALDRLATDAAHQEIARGASAIRAATGVRPRLLRPPFGAIDARLRGAHGLAAQHGQRLVMWSVETRDWATRSPLAVAAGTLRRVRPGSIVLLHDGGGDRQHVVTATRWMIGHLARLGYRFVTVPELLDLEERRGS